jgi:hypothetical protein
MELASEARLNREGKKEDLALALFHYAIAARLLEKVRGDGAALAIAQAHRATVAHALSPEIVASVWYAAQAWTPKRQNSPD